MNSVTNISLVGVGGQGILLTSDILARTAALSGMDVKKSEVHGMAQRGGSVISQVRFGSHVFSPIVMDGTSHLLVAFELLEALRWRKLLVKSGQVLINDLNMTPVTVSSGQQAAISDLPGSLATAYPQAHYIKALELAREVGNPRTMNMVVAGALSKLLPFEASCWESAMQERIPARMLEINLQAFAAGRSA